MLYIYFISLQQKVTSPVKERFSGFYSNHNNVKKRNKEYNFTAYHQIDRLYFLNTSFYFPGSLSMSKGTSNVKKLGPEFEVSISLLRSVFFYIPVYLQ